MTLVGETSRSSERTYVNRLW